jgi:methionine synthase II (cobalamin-independent)
MTTAKIKLDPMPELTATFDRVGEMLAALHKAVSKNAEDLSALDVQVQEVRKTVIAEVAALRGDMTTRLDNILEYVEKSISDTLEQEHE